MTVRELTPERREHLAAMLRVLRKRHLADPALEARKATSRKKARRVAAASRRKNRGVR